MNHDDSVNELATPDLRGKGRFKKRWIFFWIGALFYLPMIPGCIIAHSPKFGRVVDITTGAGIADAYVIAAAYMVDRGDGFIEAHTATTTEYRVVVRTDSNGRYWIPNTWLHLDFDHFYPFFGSHEESWKLTVIKLGYVLEDDWREHEDAIERGRSKATSIKWSKRQPGALWLGPVVKVQPIVLRPVQMDVGDATRYYGHAVSLGTELLRRELTSDEIALRDTTYEYFLPRVCAFDPEEKIDWGVSLSALVLDSRRYIDRWNALDKKGYEVLTQTGKSPPSSAKYVCEAMKDEIIAR
ncbi:MAG: carboxypeptidase-like regulatory domain-containing protein [Sulfuricaulis sp.]